MGGARSGINMRVGLGCQVKAKVMSLLASQELEQIPLFMTRSPETIDPEKAPAVAALQDMKYEDQTPHGGCDAIHIFPMK